ncbi:MAG: bifunctional 4-hydroxy-3-methylbut-2-enyl diphosphate reductase/30S ribosomal protein S1 [Clostridia bacterium]|nr:bifunctional 4-hydroxy-3-methylbut-2-enyl diphosphate reductase/30S ribosomal protein S1 [Clostridia bacterium]
MNCKITLAKTAGFCFGVNRAVELVYKLLDEGKKVCTLGPIIHNPQLVAELESRGVVIAENVSQVPDGYTLVIRSHGVAQAVLDDISDKNVEYSNATCPFVSKIHRIVAKNTDKDIPVFIAGDENHAEVIGIKGYAKGPVFFFKNQEQLEKITQEHPEFADIPVCVVAQTTFNSQIWEKCIFFLKKVYTNAKIFGTICDATTERQNEALSLAKQNDLMVVIGGRHSSNTVKLFDICSAITKTVLIENASELDEADVLSARSIGVTAGASTPAVIIKEVLNTMSEIIEKEGAQAVEAAENNENIMEAAEVAEKSFDDMTFEEALEASLNSMNHNQKVKGLVIAVGPTEVQVDIGRKYTGIVPADELSNDHTKRPEELVKVGDEIDLIVMKTNDQEGIITLSKRRFDAAAGFNKIADAKETQEILEGTVTAVVKGGVTMVSNGVRVFVPASQATTSRSTELETLVGNTYPFRVIDIRRGRSVVGSIRSVLREQKKAAEEAIWSKIAVGETYEGTVKSLTSYGAFVDIGGVDGMIHITELAWTRIKHPSEVVNVGDVVSVYVKDVDTEKRKISLGYKKTEDNPWEILKTKFAAGDVADVKIVSLTTYGAFANLIDGIDGLIHISQIADRRIEKPQDVLKVGDVVKAKITEIDFDAKRVSLSIRALIEPEVKEEEVAPVVEDNAVMYSTEDAPADAE